MNNTSNKNPAIQLMRASERLRYLGNCFLDTGNAEMANKLFDISYIVEDNTKELQNEHIGYINKNLNESQHQIGNILTTMLENYND